MTIPWYYCWKGNEMEGNSFGGITAYSTKKNDKPYRKKSLTATGKPYKEKK